MKVQKLWAVFLVLFVVTTGCTTTTVAGRSTQQTFTDPLTAALVIAVSQGDFGDANNALKAGANVNAVGVEGLTPLLWVMGTTLNADKIEYLLKAGANPNYRDEKSLVSPMYLAAGGNRPDILELLLKYKGDPNLRDKQTETLMMVAVFQFQDKNIDLLLKYGADINLADKTGRTVAQHAVSMGRYDLVAKFLNLGLTQNPQVLARTVESRVVPAHSEQQRWKDKVIEMLKERGAKFPAFIPRKVE